MDSNGFLALKSYPILISTTIVSIITIIIIFIVVIVASCETYRYEGLFIWRHNSLKFIANSFQSIVGSTLYVNLSGFLSPCIITNDTFGQDLLVTADKKLFVLELTVGFETNLNFNTQRKRDNLSDSCLGIFGRPTDSFNDMYKDLDINNNNLRFIIRKPSKIITRSAYFIFCRRNYPWTCPDLISF